MALTFIQLGTGLATTIKSAIIDDLRIVSAKFVALLQGTASAATIIADCLISGSLVYFLKGPTVHISTRIALHKLLIYSLNIGIVTTIMSILPVYFTTPSKLYIWEPFFIPAGQIYINSVFVCLNSRRTIREQIATRIRDQLSWGHRDLSNSRHQDYSLPLPPHPDAYNIDTPSSPKAYNFTALFRMQGTA
ncbi:hypothetical protein M422DRAFT_264090 [Sphaerobolus stellatus SS14]|uniref:DUF6534 domain-containing protein n=1 Tax=Sphaerobolus stellatus (strain SS14) TaxID=990650 RepID=A0A0C9V9L5_SPHS4|nr:hypothetical protein M422DRAFT_264090 [Sphaerobolus stellatus SS14]